mgnify:CR=1 FL=1
MNFIIYEKEYYYEQLFKKTILHCMLNSMIDYSIKIYSRYTWKEMKSGCKIYILDMELSRSSGLDFAMKIRSSGDWLSPIVLVSKTKRISGYTCKLLRLDFILKNEKLSERLKEIIEISLFMTHYRKNISFQYRGESHTILYDDILYIEKKLNDNCSFIVTKDREVCIPKSIQTLCNELDHTTFIKTHRSCLINIHNVNYVDFENGIISFGDKETDLLSRNRKKALKEVLNK